MALAMMPLVIAALMLIPGLLIGPSLDAAVFSAVGWRLSDGGLLYATVWDHKPPGVYAPQLLAQLVTNTPVAAWILIWAATVLSAAITAWLVQHRIASFSIGWPATVAGVLTSLTLSAYLLTLGGGMGESFAVVPALAGIMIVTARRPIPQPWFVAGLLLGAAVLMSLQAASVAAGLVAIGWTGGANASLRRATACGLGFLVAVALFVTSLVVTGTLPQAIDALVSYSAAYRAAIRPGGSNLLPWLLIVLLPTILPAGMALMAARRRPLASRLVLACVAWIMAAIVMIAIQGRLYGHYVLPLVPPLGLLAGIGLESMRRRLPAGRIGIAMLMGPVALLTVLALIVGAAGAPMEERWIRESNQKVGAVAPVVATLADDDSTIFVWGNEPRLYELANRRPASRYVYLYPLLTPGYANETRIGEELAAWESTPPVLIIDAGGAEPGAPGMPPLLIDRPVATDGRDLDLLDPLRAFVREHYELTETVAGWPIYTLVDP